MIIHFKNVGRDEANWDAKGDEKKDWNYVWFYKQVKSHAKVMSTDLRFDLDNADHPKTGVIYAGCHRIGEFDIEGLEGC